MRARSRRVSGTDTRAGARRIVVAGGGIAGLTFALALKRAHGAGIDVVVCDQALGEGAARHRGRAYALAAGPRRMLAQIGIWPAIAAGAQPVLDMAISDSRLADPVRPVFLTFGAEPGADGPLAHLVEAEPLVEALLAACEEAGVDLRDESVRSALPAPSRIDAELSGGERLSAALVVAADGARSRLREAAGIGWVGHRYTQNGIVATIRHERDHGGRAVQHFLPGGPFAILPLRDDAGGHRSSIVWTERAAEAPVLLSGSADEVLSEIERRFTLQLGRLSLEAGPRVFPLSVGMARTFRAKRLALLGDSAHVIHPIAGQGLNLGLAGAAALAEAATEALRLGMDPGSDDVTRTYEQARRFPVLAMVAATDGLNRLFSNDVTPVRLARDFGLGLVNASKRLTRGFEAKASHLEAAGARLLRGEPL
ncbi:FAD-dependent monooxygenase [Methylobacterium organophilum]|uniref:FAD-dependent monooxygenase n=1 Tax=Methylobacterium organophilum TaxID=410 RepID=UPI003B8452AF